MKSDLKSFEKALYPLSDSQWAGETNHIFSIGVELLETLNVSNMTREQEQEFYAAAIGTIIAGIAYHRSKYHGELAWISKEPDNKYYKVPHYPLRWGKLSESVQKELDTLETPQQPSTDEDVATIDMIKISGSKVLKGELPFEKEQMIAIFPKLEAFFNKIERERRQEYQQIETLFDQALMYKSTNTPKDLQADQIKFLDAVAELKKHTLQQFRAEHEEFDFDKCLSLAQRTKDLTDSIMSNNVTKEQIDQFEQDNKTFKGDSIAVDILCVILMTLVTIALSILCGLVIGGPAGAVVGGLVGAAGIGMTGFFATALLSRRGSVGNDVSSIARTMVDNSGTSGNDEPDDPAALKPN